MNKKKFLLYLENQLSVLNQKEREDIISEYSQHIDMKVESGLSEYEAIKDFGDLNEFVAEILEAYNIDPNYNNQQQDTFMGKFKRKITDIGDFMFNQNPVDVLKLVMKVLILCGIFFTIFVSGFYFLYNILDSIDIFGGIFNLIVLGIYAVVYGLFALYFIYVCTVRMAYSIKNNIQRDKSIIKTFKNLVDKFANFVFTQGAWAIIKMLFKIAFMSVIIFFAALIGYIIPSAINELLYSFIDIDLSFMLSGLYIFIAAVIGIYMVGKYAFILADKMTNNSRLNNELTDEGPIEEAENKKGDNYNISDVEKSFFKNIFGVFIKAAKFTFKAFVAIGMIPLLCTLFFSIVFMVTSMAFMFTGYPVVGIFICLLGFSICLLAFVLIIYSLVFERKGAEK